MAWHRIASIVDCPPGKSLEVIIGERVVALFNMNGEFFALDGVCPHQGGPLSEGEISGCIVTCPWHGWQFDVRTGQHQFSRSVVQPRFETKIDDGSVWIDILD
ncbi:MAG TPA: Rieske 2Fe-2S domain-containing protein [Pirellulales bacterium]